MHEFGSHHKCFNCSNTESGHNSNPWDFQHRTCNTDGQENQEPEPNFNIIWMCVCFTHNYVLYKGLKVCNVKNGEKKDPNDVDKVPIQSNQFYPLEIVIFSNIKRNHTHDHHTTDNMEGMKARCCKIKGPKNIFSQSYPTINLG